MNWKCVLVGLILVFPGTLISVEGRYTPEEALDEREAGYFQTLLDVFRDDQAEEKLGNLQGPVAAPAAPVQKKQNNNQQDVDDDEEDESNNDGDDKITTNDEDGQEIEVPEDPPSAPTGNDQLLVSEDGAGGFPPGKGVGSGDMVNQIDKAMRPPHAQAQRHRTGGGDAAVPATNTAFVLVVAGCTVLAAAGIIGAGVAWYKYHRSAKAASVVDYPAYGVTGPTKDRAPSPGDRKLAHSAQMYHYQHQKQQMMAMQGASSGEMKHDGSDDESVEDNDDADYTVYECPGLAPTGEMEVKNPLFCGDETPSTPANDETRQTPPEY